MTYWLKLISCLAILVATATLPAFGITKLSGWFEILEGLLGTASLFAAYFLLELAYKNPEEQPPARK